MIVKRNLAQHIDRKSGISRRDQAIEYIVLSKPFNLISVRFLTIIHDRHKYLKQKSLAINTCRSLRCRRDLQQGPGPPLTSSAAVPTRVTPFPCSWFSRPARVPLSARPAAARNRDASGLYALAISVSAAHIAESFARVWSATDPDPVCPCARAPSSNYNKVSIYSHWKLYNLSRVKLYPGLEKIYLCTQFIKAIK